MHEVLKAFRGDRPYEPGEQVDGSGWRLLPQLLSQRYLRELDRQPVFAPKRKKVSHGE